jgi:catechol 2,3-dioxygenase-like lactoylglutathione lyase family enzyme
MKLNLDTIIFYVQDVDKLRSFYTDILKLEVIEKYESSWIFLKAGNGEIGLHRIGNQFLDKIKSGYKFDNNAKIVFEIGDDINAARQQLLDQDVTMREIKTFDNYDYWLCDGEDPEGNVFQLKQRKTAVNEKG